MNIFDRHFEMLKRNQDIFEQYKLNENVGIKIPENHHKDYCKTGIELLSVERIEQLLEVRSVYYYNIVHRTLEEYTLSEWIVCLNEGILLEYAVPILSRALERYPMLCGMNNEWQVLFYITMINEEFWFEHKEWKNCFCELIKDICVQHENGRFVEAIPNEYLYQFKLFENDKVEDVLDGF